MANARHRLTGCLFALALIGALSAAPAAAAPTKKKPPPPPKPFVLDAGAGAAKPTIAVDAAGTAHIAWNLKGPSVGDDPIVYCQVLAQRPRLREAS